MRAAGTARGREPPHRAVRSELEASARFYERALGFRVERREPDYVGLRRDQAVLGLAPLSKLPPTGDEPSFTQERVLRGHGAGVEIVLEVDDPDAALRRVEETGHTLVEGLRPRPWGLHDFRVVDPDGYYIRVTAG